MRDILQVAFMVMVLYLTYSLGYTHGVMDANSTTAIGKNDGKHDGIPRPIPQGR